MPTKKELLEEKTVKELREMAKERSLSGYSRMTKDELIDLINENYLKDEIRAWPDLEEEETEEVEEEPAEEVETEEVEPTEMVEVEEGLGEMPEPETEEVEEEVEGFKNIVTGVIIAVIVLIVIILVYYQFG